MSKSSAEMTPLQPDQAFHGQRHLEPIHDKPGFLMNSHWLLSNGLEQGHGLFNRLFNVCAAWNHFNYGNHMRWIKPVSVDSSVWILQLLQFLSSGSWKYYLPVCPERLTLHNA